MSHVLSELSAVLEQRKEADPESSYVAHLYHKGLNSILKKMGEETAETIIAAKDGNREQIIYETADLWFHTMVMLSDRNIAVDEVLGELERRFGLSGHEEKKSRESTS